MQNSFGLDFCSCDDGVMEMTYRSKRPLADLAEGLIRACVEHFGDDVEISRERPIGSVGPDRQGQADKVGVHL